MPICIAQTATKPRCDLPKPTRRKAKKGAMAVCRHCGHLYYATTEIVGGLTESWEQPTWALVSNPNGETS